MKVNTTDITPTSVRNADQGSEDARLARGSYLLCLAIVSEMDNHLLVHVPRLTMCPQGTAVLR
jgi:hypothetical protein